MGVARPERRTYVRGNGKGCAMSNAADGRGLATDEFDDDEIEWDEASDSGDDEDGLSPIEGLVDVGSDIFDGDDDDAEDDADDDRN
jgi:hypothetical protein